MTSDDAATAANWRTVLMVDALLGVAAAAAGLWLATSGRPVVGGLLLLGGIAYAAMVGRRWSRWRRIRTDAGLP